MAIFNSYVKLPEGKSRNSNQWGLTLAGKRLLFMFENELILALQVLEDGDLQFRWQFPVDRLKHQRRWSFQVVSSFRSHRYGGYGAKNWKRMEIQTMSDWSKKKFLVLTITNIILFQIMSH